MPSIGRLRLAGLGVVRTVEDDTSEPPAQSAALPGQNLSQAVVGILRANPENGVRIVDCRLSSSDCEPPITNRRMHIMDRRVGFADRGLRGASATPGIPRRARRNAALVAALAFCSVATPPALLGQSAPEEPAAQADRRNPFLLWTKTSREDRVIWGQWTRHLSDTRTHVSNDRIIAVVYRGLFGGTFRTTHGPRGYSVGVERAWFSGSRGIFGGMVGFRTGLVYGYDERLGWLAEDLPLLPFASPMIQGRIGPLTAEVTHTWVVLSLTAGVRF